ncbi:sperm acrosome membrane-associated protein 4-like [Paramormyrops kingsleyae]|uniref:sperm acrosome membrane-associated protein 4-like n=1 Tax=Paramormyrops kingsleyae TaxID=1676925 RepID=UPI003B9702FC
MNRVLVGVLAAIVLFAFGHSLECHRCDLGFWNMCLTTKMTCKPGEQCFSGTGKAAHVIDIKKKGCLRSEDCNQESIVSFFTNKTLYSFNTTCCATDLCNAAPRLSLPAPLLLAVLMLSFVGVHFQV